MLLVGLTGGIGSGKSTVARLLQERGAVVFDADAFARQAVEPGSHGFAEVIRAFGPDVVTYRGELNREWLAGRVFDDREARRRLEAIVHPEVARLLAEALQPYRDTDSVAVYVVPLLVENLLASMFDVVVTVEAPEEVRVARLVRDRSMTEAQARARIAAQVTDAERADVADIVIPNDGTEDALRERVDRLVDELATRERSKADPAG
jgi:dephospho-CoA kinase